MFLSKILTHNAMEIQGGIRNIVNTFVYQVPLKWKHRKHKEKTRFKRKGPLEEAGDTVRKLHKRKEREE
jgi:hypothetical protein